MDGQQSVYSEGSVNRFKYKIIVLLIAMIPLNVLNASINPSTQLPKTQLSKTQLPKTQTDQFTHSNKIKVRVFKSARPITIKGFNVSFNNEVIKKQRITSAFNLDKYSIRRIKKNSEEFVWQVIDESGAIKEFFVNKLSIKGDYLRKGLKKLPEELYLKMTQGKKSNPSISGITIISMNDYLKGVLPSEMPASWPLEALKAQAVASRSYTVHMINQRKNNSFHLDSNIFDQVYKVYEKTDLLKSYRDKVKRAIDETGSLVLLNENNKVAPGYYHADCGGQTEEPFNVWDGSISNGTVKDASCPMSPFSHWRYGITNKVLTGQLLSQQLITSEDSVKNFDIKKKSNSGRILSMDVNTEKGQTIKMSAQKLRSILGFTKIKSAMFQIIKKKDYFLFFGKGHGHGVGLCQWGTRYLATRGLKFKEILKHYYPNTLLSER